MSDETTFMRFLQDPTRENFLRIRSEVVAHEDYQPYSTDLDEAAQLLEQEKWSEFIDAGRGMIPNHLLTPRFHMMRSFALHKMGVKEDSEIESVMYACCIQGIFSTGDGSENAPWLVLRTGDEDDVLHELDLRLVKQSLHRKGDRSFDCMECSDGKTYWFDITDAFKKMSDQIRN